MLLPLVLLFIVVPIAELAVIIQVGQAIGVWWTIGLLVADSILGSLLMRAQGRSAWRRFNDATRAGRATNYRSYAMERVVALAAYLSGFGASGFEPGYYAWACFVLMTVVVIHDAKRMLIDPVPAAGGGGGPA